MTEEEFDDDNPHPSVIHAEMTSLRKIYTARKTEQPEMNQYYLADICGWKSQSTVSHYLNGRMPLNLDALLKLSKALRFDAAEVSPRLAKRLPPVTNVQEPHQKYVNDMTQTGRILPIIGYVQAGNFCEAVDEFQPGDADEWTNSGGPASAKSFILRVEGISMIEDFHPGDLVVIDPELPCDPGHFVLARKSSDSTVTLKRLRKEGSDYFLEASNPSWPNRIILLSEEWSICGRARRKIVEL